CLLRSWFLDCLCVCWRGVAQRSLVLFALRAGFWFRYFRRPPVSAVPTCRFFFHTDNHYDDDEDVCQENNRARYLSDRMRKHSLPNRRPRGRGSIPHPIQSPARARRRRNRSTKTVDLIARTLFMGSVIYSPASSPSL